MKSPFVLGAFAAFGAVCIVAIYLATGAFWWFFAGTRSHTANLTPGDPYLAVLEALLVVICPFFVVTMATLPAYAAREDSLYAYASLSFMTLLAGITASVHFVDLVVVRRMPAELRTSIAPVVSIPWHWPSVFFAVDLFAWDVFFGLSMLFGACVFVRRRQDRLTRYLMLASGVLCVVGVLGPVLDDLRFQFAAIVGYAGWAGRFSYCSR